MKSLHNLAIFILFSCGLHAQTVLDTNNSAAALSDNGIMFNSSANFPGYEIPKGSGLNTIFSAAMWYGGPDSNGQLKMAVNDLYGANQDVWPGPLTNIGSATPMPTGAWTPTMWTVSKEDIDQHLLNFQNTGYITPANIATWPAHGDVALGFDFYLAPFVDTDLDGNYDPTMGDYPCIKGDMATFFIMNDKANVHGSGADPIGIELHYMFYQYDQPGDIGNTTFMDVKMINRSNQTLFDFYVGMTMDGDLGNSQDDFVGCDTTRNLQYYYNDINDEAGLGTQGYGLNPPSFGVVCLTDNINSAVTMNGPSGFPNSPAAKYNVMKGLNPNGSARYVGTTSTPTTFEYFDAPSSSGWSEVAGGGFPGERRTSMAINIGTLTPAMEKTLTYAVVYNRSGNNNIQNVDSLLLTTDAIQSFHNNSTDGDCSQSILGLNNPASDVIEFKLFPNPTRSDFVLEMEQVDGANYTITDMSGRVLTQENLSDSKTIISLNAPSGVYLVRVSSNKGTQTKRLILK